MNPMTERWAVYDSWAVYPDQAGTVKRSVAVRIEGSPDTVVVVGALHPTATEYQARALVVAQHIADLHNASLG